MPADTPTARLTSKSARLSPDAKMPGKNAGEMIESPTSVAIIASGAVNNATAYHLAATRHTSARERSSRSDARPWTSTVSKIPARLGPTSIAITAYAKRGSPVGVVPRICPAPPIASNAPPQEIANVRTKYAGAGCFLMAERMADMAMPHRRSSAA